MTAFVATNQAYWLKSKQPSETPVQVLATETGAMIAEEILDELDAPIRRVASLDIPIPFNIALENYVLPNDQKIVAAVRDAMSF